MVFLDNTILQFENSRVVRADPYATVICNEQAPDRLGQYFIFRIDCFKFPITVFDEATALRGEPECARFIFINCIECSGGKKRNFGLIIYINLYAIEPHDSVVGSNPNKTIAVAYGRSNVI